MGASPGDGTDTQAATVDEKAEARLARKKDRQETDYLRSLGVGSNLEPSDGESEELPQIASSAVSKQEFKSEVTSAVASGNVVRHGEPMRIPTTFEAVD